MGRTVMSAVVVPLTQTCHEQHASRLNDTSSFSIGFAEFAHARINAATTNVTAPATAGQNAQAVGSAAIRLLSFVPGPACTCDCAPASGSALIRRRAYRRARTTAPPERRRYPGPL